ncbi:MAG: thioredoxin family protein [Legionella sp.]
MAKTSSVMLPLGTIAPQFSLLDVCSGSRVSLNPNSQSSVIMFICNHCPYVKFINKSIVNLANDYIHKGVAFYAINSNDSDSYPEDSAENMKKVAIELAYPFPYLLDITQDVAKAYQAACTPDFYVFDHQQSLIYRGQLDDARPSNHMISNGESIRSALDCLLMGKEVTVIQKPSMGCNIKWKT